MRARVLAMVTVLGLAGWHVHDVTANLTVRPIRTAYQDAIQRYSGGQTLQRSAAPQRTQPVADSFGPASVDDGRVTGKHDRPRDGRSAPCGLG